jgi:zinc transport system substrate-binding protein
MVGNIYDALIQIDPDNQMFYDKNRKQYIKELDNLANAIVRLLREKKGRNFMVFHPAWGYFARAYDLKQIPIEKQGKEPTAQGILRLIEQAEQNNVKVVFASPQFNTKSAKVIAKEIQGQVILIDPLEKEYIANLKKITSILVQVME